MILLLNFYNKYYFSVFLILFISFILPLTLSAQTVEPSLFSLAGCTGTDCTACHVVGMANGLIKWLIGILFLLFAALMMIAGVRLVTSAGNPAALNEAKEKFINAIIGFLIILSAWLIVDTIMRGLVGKAGDPDSRGMLQTPGSGGVRGGLAWSQVECQVISRTSTSTTMINLPKALQEEHSIIQEDTGGEAVSNSGTPSPNGCSVPGLSAMTDPQALQMEGGTRVVYNNQTLQRCAARFVSQAGGTIVSAYRPAQYQNHLWEVVDRWCTQGLRNNNDAACAPLKQAVQREYQSHFGGRACTPTVAINSRHTTGTAVDISGINHGSQSVRAAAQQNCLRHNAYAGDSNHYELISGCSCN